MQIVYICIFTVKHVNPQRAVCRQEWHILALIGYDEAMTDRPDDDRPDDSLHISQRPALHEATLVLALSGWMDGGDVSTGTIRRLLELTKSQPIADIDPEPFYIYNIPGSMEMATLFRPHIEIKDGLVQTLEMPTSVFYSCESANLVLFVGKEPNMSWRRFGQCILRLASEVGVRRIVFVGSYGGSVPHTREPRLYVTCSEQRLLPEMQQYGVARTGYEGPGSITSVTVAIATRSRNHFSYPSGNSAPRLRASLTKPEASLKATPVPQRTLFG